VRQQLDCSQTELGYGVVRELWAFELNRWASKSLYVHPYVIRHAHHISRRGVPVPRVGAVMAEAQGFHQLPAATHSLPSHYVNNFHLSLIQCVSSDFRLPSWLLSYFYTISQVERIARATSGNHRACQDPPGTPRTPLNTPWSTEIPARLSGWPGLPHLHLQSQMSAHLWRYFLQR
jgi:hypothetical protein